MDEVYVPPVLHLPQPPADPKFNRPSMLGKRVAGEPLTEKVLYEEEMRQYWIAQGLVQPDEPIPAIEEADSIDEADLLRCLED